MTDVKQAKEYLSQIQKNDRLIHRLQSTVDSLRSGLTSQNYELKADRIQTSGPKNAVEETIIRIVDFEREINQRIDELVALKRKIFTEISRIPEQDQQNVLIGRYIQGIDWEDIAKDLTFSVQWVYEIHKKALLNFAKYNPDIKKTE